MNLIILSRNPALYSTNSLVSAARKRGHYVRVIDHMRCNLVVENGNPAIYYQNESLKAVSAVIPRIGSSATEYGSSVARQFESMDIFTTTRSTALLQSRDKLRCLQILNAHGVDIPKSVMVYDSYSINEMLHQIGSYPVVIKLLNSTQGLGVMLAENEKNAISVVDAFQKIKQKVIIQEFIEESQGFLS
jgi:ribosomal protein S6--L-glutamate ligase